QFGGQAVSGRTHASEQHAGTGTVVGGPATRSGCTQATHTDGDATRRIGRGGSLQCARDVGVVARRYFRRGLTGRA
ncbi:hypothetical protein, partial [Streptomyces lunaelactis]|uniref:hypothetical protein n=1 Tax=Streptomyces lunaelactis TaxID=1535768 RepID=UPI001C2F2E5B